ncbi:receptor-type tyrosine-protein kinase FLT3-like isoform X2 [Pungitius pungitius]|uniref:receptor-type tyrosine-protein kinase FLT3-like isoform X2 n=1 Tax=Pungitius pungitius TaxID=134920 RepID=UPI002E117EE4
MLPLFKKVQADTCHIKVSLCGPVMIIFLLCAVELHCSHGIAAQNQACASNPEAACFVPVDYLNASGSVSVEVCPGKTLVISLEQLSEFPVCQWIKGADTILTVNGSSSMVLSALSETDSGEFTLSCESSEGTRRSLAVSLRVVNKRPTKPKLTLSNVEDSMRSPLFTCSSEGCPKPTIEWSGNKRGEDVPAKGLMAISKLSSIYLMSEAMCCATNAEGQECSPVYDYDLDTDLSNNVSTPILSPGQSLLLRCRMKRISWAIRPDWENSSRVGTKISACSSQVKEICTKADSHDGLFMSYLLIRSVNVHHSGTYTCRTTNNKTKSVDIRVQAEGLVSVQLDENLTISAENASHHCLEAIVSYQHVMQQCSWEAPDEKVTKCQRDTWVTHHRIVKLRDGLKSGDYKLHLKADGQKVTKTISVCVVEKPRIHFNYSGNITAYTVTLVPAKYTWIKCHNSCANESSWVELKDTSQTDSDDKCYKTIKSLLKRDPAPGERYKFCVTNKFGSWCEPLNILNIHSPQPAKATANADDGLFMVLKVGSLFLLLALAMVSLVLMYFIKKKKPRYQPQLQIIQMVGPNDNDYIYINFKEFGYDLKWEFPRENLELGQELGSGAFGTVVQATAYGINKPGVSQQVAVKMLKEKHQTLEKEALMSELKMLTHIGHHANIVNLLGACTTSEPTYLIFQYCCHGDLLNYLKTNRERYHKSATDAFNKIRFSNLFHHKVQPNRTSGEEDSAVGNYMPMYGTATRGQEDIALLGDMDSYEDAMIDEDCDEQTEDLQILTFDDLLSFAFQVAKGMEFLSSKNCIHRDLAARNVLVTSGKRVKIGDFGLARDIENDSNYVVRGNVRLPVKWMAPESTFQGIYTAKSDVWAYGILLWEIFSLGVTPYPGMKVDHTFYTMIERGFKMDCPYYANESVYGMMCKCWSLDPSNRPSFSKLVSLMYDWLTDGEEKLYHNTFDQTSGDYQNAATILDISALAKQGDNKTQSANDYRGLRATEEGKDAASDAEAADEKLVRPPDTE